MGVRFSYDFGGGTAAFVMERLPTTNWDQLVTKDYLREQLQQFETRSSIASTPSSSGGSTTR